MQPSPTSAAWRCATHAASICIIVVYFAGFLAVRRLSRHRRVPGSDCGGGVHGIRSKSVHQFQHDLHDGEHGGDRVCGGVRLYVRRLLAVVGLFEFHADGIQRRAGGRGQLLLRLHRLRRSRYRRRGGFRFDFSSSHRSTTIIRFILLCRAPSTLSPRHPSIAPSFIRFRSGALDSYRHLRVHVDCDRFVRAHVRVADTDGPILQGN